MLGSQDELWFDDDAGRLVRPYTVSNGRTQPSTNMELLSWVVATGRVPRGYLEPDHARALRLCGGPTTVAEIAAHLKLPAAITKVVLSDLVDCGAVSTRAPGPVADPNDRSVLEAVLNGLQRRL
jgi:hypothetical protein